MALTKTVNIDGRDVTFRADAAIPRIYRNRFHRDIYKDLRDLQKSIDGEDPEASTIDSFSLELFEDISYVMAKHVDSQGAPDTPDEWLEQFGTFSIYQVLPEIIELWRLNVQTQVVSKKLRPTDWEMTPPLLLLRAVQLGVHISEMDLATIGTINDVYSEMQRDEEPHAQMASQEDFDGF